MVVRETSLAWDEFNVTSLREGPTFDLDRMAGTCLLHMYPPPPQTSIEWLVLAFCTCILLLLRPRSNGWYLPFAHLSLFVICQVSHVTRVSVT